MALFLLHGVFTPSKKLNMRNHVLTITPSPTLDLGGKVDNLMPNEKSYVHDETKSPGGNAINVARILTRLNIPVVATGFLGGSTGEEIKFLLGSEGVKNNFIQIEGHSRICVTVSNQADHKQTRLTFPGPKIKRDEKKKLLKFFETQKKTSLLVFGGSLPEGFGTEDLKHLIDNAKKKDIKVIVDCPGKILRAIVSEGPFLIKPNLNEFQEMTNSTVETINEVHQKARRYLDKVPFICVSSVEGGALLVTRHQTVFGKITKVKVRSTVGAGDSMVGAMVAELFKGNLSVENLLRWGLAAAAATLSHHGTAFGKAQEIRSLYKLTKVEEV